MKNIGIIGCGKIAQTRHIPEYEKNKDAVLKGFFDTNKERARELSKKYGAKVYDSYEALLSDPEIDAVSVLTPNFTHASISIAAMEAGKDVLCEKPMAVTLEECIAMEETAKRTGHKLMIGQNQRLVPAHVIARKLLCEGAIGKVISFKTVFAHSGADNWSIDGKNSWFMDKNRSCFGALADLGVHKTDLMFYLLGKKIRKVSAVIGTLYKKNEDGTLISVDDNAFCTYVMDDGIIGTMNASWTNYGYEDNSTSIYGSEGVMHIFKDPNHSIIIERIGKAPEYIDAGEIQTNDNQTASGIVDLFIKCLVEDTAPAISAEDVMPAMKAIFACVKSAENNSEFITID